MASKTIDFSEFQSLYETCSGSRDLKEFCKDSGVNYNKFVSWRRKQFRDEKLGIPSSRMVPVAVVDVPDEIAPCGVPSSVASIRFVEVKFCDGVSLRRFNVSVDELVSQITKISSALC